MKLIQKTNFLIFLSMLLVLSSCQTGTSSETTDDGIIEQTESTPETMVETTPFAALDTRDFGGKTFCIIDGNDYPDMHINLSSGELTGNVLNDAIFTRDGLVTEKLNVVLQAQTETCANAVRQFRNNVTAGDHSYQLIIAPVLGDGLINLVTDGAVYDLNNISRGNDAYWGKPWWSDLMYENMQLNGNFTIPQVILPLRYIKPRSVCITILISVQIMGMMPNSYLLILKPGNGHTICCIPCAEVWHRI